jgi:TM2 domain-containing membrane protein YozV
MKPTKDTQIAYLLLVPSFLGVAGLHRFYLRRYITAVIWLLTGGLFLIGTIVDLFLIPSMVRSANAGR